MKGMARKCRIHALLTKYNIEKVDLVGGFFFLLYYLVVEKHDCNNVSHCLFGKIISNLGYLVTCFPSDVIYGDFISLCSRKIYEDTTIQIHADLVFEKSNLKSSSWLRFVNHMNM